MGGHDSMYIAFTHPEIFSLVGSYSGNFLVPKDMIKTHNQKLFPIQLWISVGRNDNNGLWTPIRELANAFKEANLSCEYVEDNGTHISMIAQRLEDSIEFFSEVPEW